MFLIRKTGAHPPHPKGGSNLDSKLKAFFSLFPAFLTPPSLIQASFPLTWTVTPSPTDLTEPRLFFPLIFSTAHFLHSTLLPPGHGIEGPPYSGLPYLSTLSPQFFPTALNEFAFAFSHIFIRKIPGAQSQQRFTLGLILLLAKLLHLRPLSGPPVVYLKH